MSPHRWTVTGWILLGIAGLLAVLSFTQVLDVVSGIEFRSQPPDTSIVTPADHDAAVDLLRGVVAGALAGVSFFAGIACFFWSALLESRQQMARLLESLTTAIAREPRALDTARVGHDR